MSEAIAAEDKASLTVIDAIKALVAVCDGATTKDGQGFNRFDREEHAGIIDKVVAGEPLSPGEEKKAYSLLKKYKKQLTGLGINFDDIGHIPRDEDEGDSSDEFKKAISDAVDRWIGEWHFKTIRDTGRVYRYDSGVYKSDAEVLIGWLMEQEFKGRCTTYYVKEAIGMVKRRTDLVLEPSDFNPSIINVQNGLLNLETSEIMPHTPDHWSVTQLPITYDPTADCPKIKKFFGEVVHSEDIPLLEEVVGWTLHWWEYIPHKAIMLYGAGRNGKGTFIRLLEAFLGIGNVSHIGLQKLVSNPYAGHSLVDKAANVFGDLPMKDLSETEIFKACTGEDTVNVENKFVPAFDYKNWAKMIFGANKLPKTPDNTDGFYSRWIIILFPYRFDMPPRSINPNLDKELQTPEELSGLLNLAMSGRQRLKSNNWQFSYRLTMDDVKNMYRRLSDPVFAFIQDCCEPSEDAIPKRVLFNTYKDYAKGHNLPSMTMKKFVTSVEEQDYIPVDACKIGPQGSQSKAFLGIRLRPEEADRPDSTGSNIFNLSKEKNNGYSEENIEEEKEIEKKRDIRPIDEEPGLEKKLRSLKFKAIYVPGGKAYEYGKLAMNPYNGCSHKCSYCFCPDQLHISKEVYHTRYNECKSSATPENVEHDIKLLQAEGIRIPVFFCFNGDLYDRARQDYKLPRQLLEVFSRLDYPVTILTKNPMPAINDLDLFKPDWTLGTTITTFDTERAAIEEPGAAPPIKRLEALYEAHSRGIKTFVSAEPILNLKDSIEVIEWVTGIADEIKIGPLNHDARSKDMDWPAIAKAVKDALDQSGIQYLLKKDLLKHLDEGTMATSAV